MTKAELVERVAKEVNLSKTATERVINTLTSQVVKCLKRKDKITLTGFGTWSVSKRKARKGRNPQTGMEIRIPARNVPKFTAGKAFRSAVR